MLLPCAFVKINQKHKCQDKEIITSIKFYYKKLCFTQCIKSKIVKLSISSPNLNFLMSITEISVSPTINQNIYL